MGTKKGDYTIQEGHFSAGRSIAPRSCILVKNNDRAFPLLELFQGCNDSKVDIKALDTFQINSKLIWDCHQSPVKLAECNRIQLVWVPGYTGIDGNEIADQLAMQGSSQPLIGPELPLAYLQRLPGE
jgi:hypothetical protein